MIDIKGMISRLNHVLRHKYMFTGDHWYVDAGMAASGNGFYPHTAFQAIGEAITAASAGDSIIVKAGVYNENGLDLAVNGLELNCEIGAVLQDTVTGVQTLLVSGNYCKVKGLSIVQAGQIGLNVTGNYGWFEDITTAVPTVGFDSNGLGCHFIRCYSAAHTVTGLDISNANCIFRECWARGSGGATRGFYLSHANADGLLFRNCASVGNATAGWHVIAGADNNTFIDCSSGGGDGARLDLGANNTWPEYSFENLLHVIQTFAGGGGSSTNLFRVYGIVEISFIYGIVETVLSTDVGNINIDLFPAGGAATDITDIVAGGNAAVGSLFIKATEAADPLILQSSATPFIHENTNWREPFVNTILGAQGDGTATYIRSTYSGVATSGAIDWHIEWRPLSDDGFVDIV